MLFFAALTPFVALVWLYLKAKKDRSMEKFVSPHLKSRLLPSESDHSGLQAVFFILGLMLVFIAAARPQWGRSDEKIETRSRNVVIAIDVSRSMLAEDVRPNRLERAKADVADLIDSLGDDRAAIVAFRRQGIVVCPLTSDHAFLRYSLEQISPRSAPPGETDLGAAIRASLDALNTELDNHNAIIIISDGGDLKGEVKEFAEKAKERRIPIFTIGIGDPDKETTLCDEDGSTVMYKDKPVEVRLEEETLKKIAEISSGRYVSLATSGTAWTTLGDIYNDFLRQVVAIEQNEIESKAAERYQTFLRPALVLLLIGAGLSKGRFRRVKK